MRSVLCLFLLGLWAWPAHAGMVNYSNGRGAWQSTSCTKPIAPAYVGLGGETAASGMNAASTSYNAFVAETQKYLDCITQEVRADSKMVGDVMMMSLNAQSQEAVEEVNRARSQLYGK